MTDNSARGTAPATPKILHICTATDQVLANVLPLKSLPWDGLMVLATDRYLQEDLEKSRLGDFWGWVKDEARRRGLDEQSFRFWPLRGEDLSWKRLLAEAHRLRADLAQSHPGWQIEVNLTGGTKLMSQSLAMAFAGHARLLYCNTAHKTLDVLDPSGDIPALALPQTLLSLPEYLQVQGFELAGGNNPEDSAWLDGLHRRKPLTVLLAQHATDLARIPGLRRGNDHGGNLLSWLHRAGNDSLPVNKGPAKDRHGFVPRARIPAPQDHPVWQALVAQIESLGIASVEGWSPPDRGGELILKWQDEAAAFYLAGGYLEEYVTLCVTGLGLEQKQWRTNVCVRARTSDLPQDAHFQELDLAVVSGNRMLIVECKAGSKIRTSGGKSQDVLNKLIASSKLVGGALSEAWLVTPFELLPEESASTLERARKYGIRMVHGPRQIAKLPLNLAKALGVPPGVLIHPSRELVELKALLAPPRS